MCPPTQDVIPAAPHAPMPQSVCSETYPSSIEPLQLSSIPSHELSVAAGDAATQLSMTTPPTQLASPARAQAPTPQLVACNA